MQIISLSRSIIALSLASSTLGHVAFWHPSMFGFNFTGHNNPPQYPIQQRKFAGDDGWWFHGYMNYPPHPEDVLELPAGGEFFGELTCDKAATSYFKTGTGTDLRDGNKVCPGQGTLEFHTKDFNDIKGTALAIAYTPASQASKIQPEDFVIFSVNQTSPWERFTKYQIPADMPACPEGGCTCAWFWIHSQDAGSEQNYMNTYQCTITGAKSTVPLAKPQVPRRCGADSDPELVKAFEPKNCTYGAKQPLYWFQQEKNNVFEGPHGPPFYNDLYYFKDGAQNDIFVNSELPAMDWIGAPITGKLEAVAGIFSGLTSIIPNAQPSSPDPAPESSSNDSSSQSSSAAPAPSPTTKGSAPNNVENNPSDASSSPAATSPPSNVESNPSDASSAPVATSTPATKNSKPSPKKMCKKNKMKRKRTIADTLSLHKRQSFRRHH